MFQSVTGQNLLGGTGNEFEKIFFYHICYVIIFKQKHIKKGILLLYFCFCVNIEIVFLLFSVSGPCLVDPPSCISINENK